MSNGFCCTARTEEHRSRETVLGTRLPNGAFMQNASCRKWHELSAHRGGIFCPSPNPFHTHMFLTYAFLCNPTNDCVCNKMSAPCGLARQQVRSKADFAHPCVESFVPSRQKDLSKCLARFRLHSPPAPPDFNVVASSVHPLAKFSLRKKADAAQNIKEQNNIEIGGVGGTQRKFSQRQTQHDTKHKQTTISFYLRNKFRHQ